MPSSVSSLVIRPARYVTKDGPASLFDVQIDRDWTFGQIRNELGRHVIREA